jgi:hypothetical protein
MDDVLAFKASAIIRMLVSPKPRSAIKEAAAATTWRRVIGGLPSALGRPGSRSDGVRAVRAETRIRIGLRARGRSFSFLGVVMMQRSG